MPVGPQLAPHPDRKMRFPQLIATIRDPMNSTRVEQTFLWSPVTVGRADDKARLGARMVSRHHGAFLFGEGGLYYADLGSTNGSFIDGRPAAPNVLVDIDPATVTTIGPFPNGTDLRIVHLPRLPSDPAARTSVEPASSCEKRDAPIGPSTGAPFDGHLSFAIGQRGRSERYAEPFR